MTNFTRYPSYKDSGIEWLGEIPAHWEVKKSKFVSNNKTTKSFESDFKIALENIESQTARYIETQEVVFSEAGINFKKGDVLFGKLRPYLAKVYLAEKDGICVSEFLVLESKNIENLFLKYILISSSWIQHINSSTYGTKMPRASWDFIGNSLVPLPPKDEQTKIAAFLDEKTTQINQAIAQKERLVELLKEKKQITINDAVTKGLTKNATLKDSGIEWLGKIPEHWEVKKLFGLCKFIRGNSIFSKDELLNNGKYVALQYGKIYKVDEVDERYKFYVNDEFYKSSQIVNFGDTIFISTSETIEDLGHSAYYKRSDLGLLGGEQILLNPKIEIIDSKYLYFSSKVFSKELQRFATGIKVFRFNVNDLKTIYMPIPPKSEQIQIVEYLQNQTTQIDKAIQLQQNYIAKLKEYKASLIDSVVRGKVRVG